MPLRPAVVRAGARPPAPASSGPGSTPTTTTCRNTSASATRSATCPPRDSLTRRDVEHVRREKEIIKRRILRLCDESPRLRDFIDESVAAFRGTPGDPASFDALHELLEEQVYRLAYWRVAAEEINYRRFFDVNELAGLRTEDPRIFDLIHSLIFRWVGEGGVTGLRIDHPDGLADPRGLLPPAPGAALPPVACRRRLADEGREYRLGRGRRAAPRRGTARLLAADPASPLARRFPIVAEKILSRGEKLPADWPIDGTVGYEFLNVLNGVFVDPKAEAAIDAIYREFTGDDEPFAEVLHAGKLLVEDRMLASELTTLTAQLNRVAETGSACSRDFTLNDLRRALARGDRLLPRLPDVPPAGVAGRAVRPRHHRAGGRPGPAAASRRSTSRSSPSSATSC